MLFYEELIVYQRFIIRADFFQPSRILLTISKSQGIYFFFTMNFVYCTLRI